MRNGTANQSVVFWASTLVIGGFVLCGLLNIEATHRVLSTINTAIVDYASWLFVLGMAVFILVVLWAGLGRYGHVRLGGDDSRPEFSTLSWFAMLLSAGVAIGLFFFGVAEPILHYSSPPFGEGGTPEAASRAMGLSFFHWGFHAWGCYALVGLLMGLMAFRHGLPLTMRSALYPLIGDRIYGPIGHVIDVLAVFGTMFGVCTSLGLGAMQINAGLAEVTGIAVSSSWQLVIIAVITLMATASVVSGLTAGVKKLSEINVSLSLILFLFVLVAGPTVHLLGSFFTNLVSYGKVAVEQGLWFAADGTAAERAWFGDWTAFYWAWWIAWTPFVGIFIARISRGRTVREFVFGVLGAPALTCFAALTILGNTALELQTTGQADIVAVAEESVPQTLFFFLQQLPLSAISSVFALVCVVIFFVTSSDSASLVIDILTSGGDLEPPVWKRVFWAVTEGVVAAVLLVAGGLAAFQMASIITALPFVLVMLVMCVSLYRALRDSPLQG